MPGTRSAPVASPLPVLAVPARDAGTAILERVLFWVFVAALAWVPFWYGSNDLIAWGINAILFAGLAGVYEISLLIRGRDHPVGIRYLALPAALFGAVAAWTALQTLAWPIAALHHPAWGL